MEVDLSTSREKTYECKRMILEYYLNMSPYFYYLNTFLILPYTVGPRNLDKIAKPFNETILGLKCMLQGLRTYFV